MPTAPLFPWNSALGREEDPNMLRELFLSDWDLRFEKTQVVPQNAPQPPQQRY